MPPWRWWLTWPQSVCLRTPDTSSGWRGRTHFHLSFPSHLEFSLPLVVGGSLPSLSWGNGQL